MNDIRAAELDDLEELVEIGELMFKFGGLDEFYPYVKEIAREQFKVLIESDDGFLWVLDTEDGIQGMIAAHCFIGICGTSPVTYEQYIFVTEKYRGGSVMRQFMKEYHDWGDTKGAVLQFMVSHEDHEKFERFYGIYGYKASERTYIRKT